MSLTDHAWAGDPDRPGREFAEMLWMIVTKGADMGPTDGWFHPSQTRYGWDWLRSRDKDGDGAIVLEELRGPAELFHRLDRNHDGVIKAEDLDWTPQSAFLRQQATARRRFAMMDSNANGRVSKEEWDAFFVKAAKGKSGLTLDALGDALDPPPPAPPKHQGERTGTQSTSGPSRWTLLKGLFSGELGSRFEGPRVGDLAPDFSLKTHDGKREISLSKLRAGSRSS